MDDEPIALELMAKLLEDFEGIEILGSFTDPIKALEFTRQNPIDTIFLDIEMGSHNGIEMGQTFINENPSLDIVFVTAYSQYAVEAFELNAIDYLLKPVEEKRLAKSLNRIKNARLKKRDGDAYTENRNDLQIKSFGSLQVFNENMENIAWRTQKTKELFAYLWLEEMNPVSKFTIMDNIFPDRDLEKAATILHTTVYQLRKVLKELGYPKAISYKNESYTLEVNFKSDKEEVKKIVKKEKLSDQEIVQLSQLYQGDLLEEESYPWIINDQQKLKELVFHKIEDYAGFGDFKATEGIDPTWDAGVVEKEIEPDPEKPVDPEDPEKPTDPEDPEKPVDPEDPEDPKEPGKPSDPKDPEDPKKPSKSDLPKTGSASSLGFLLLGSSILGLGLSLRRKKDKK